MSKKVPVAPIGRGLNDSIAPSEQPSGTYREGFNVRGIDPRTGRIVWGAQRAGLSEFGDNFDAGFPTCIATTFRLRSAREWYEITGTPEPNTVPQTVSQNWGLELPSVPVDVSVGPDGQAYYLLGSGDVAVVNPKGRLVETIRSAAPYGYQVIPRVFVAEEGSVFVASANTEENELPRAFLSRWVREEDDTWTQSWEAEFEDPIATFGYSGGAMYVVLEPVEDQSGVLPSAKLARVSQPLLGPELRWERGGLPRPCFDAQVNERGEAVLSFPSSAERNLVNSGFGTRSVSWTPAQETDWDLDGWAWVDAFAVNESDSGLEDGAVVDRMRDRRHEEEIFAKPDETSPVRDLRKPQGGVFSSPTYDADAFGGLGGVRFAAGNALVSGFNRASDDHAEQLALIPAERLQALEKSYICAMVIQVSEDRATVGTTEYASQRRLLSQLFELVGISTTTGANWEAFFSAGTGGPGGAVTLVDNGVGGPPAPVTGPPNSTTRSAVISWQWCGDTGQGVGTSPSTAAYQQFELFLDGVSVGVWTGTTPMEHEGGPWSHVADYDGQFAQIPGPFTVFGGGLPNQVNLLRDTTEATLSLGNGQSSFGGSSVDVLRDGVRDQFGATILVNDAPSSAGIFANNPYVQADLGPGGDNRAIDSISISHAVTDLAELPDFLEVRLWNHADWLATPNDPTWEGLIRTSYSGTPRVFNSNHEKVGENGNSYRIIQVGFFNTIGSGSKRVFLSEFEVHYQDTFTVRDTGEFTLGEFISKSTTWGADGAGIQVERQRLEGYLAHRFGIQAQLTGHPYLNSPPTGTGSRARQDRAQVEAALRSPWPILAKYGTDGEPVTAYTGAGVGLGAALSGDDIYTIGESEPPPGVGVAFDGTMLTHFTDDGYSLTREGGLNPSGGAEGESPAIQPTRLALGPRNSLYVPYIPAQEATGVNSIRRYDSALTLADWTFGTTERPQAIAAAGFQIDESQRLGPAGSEFLYAAVDTLDVARRIDTMGLRDTGQKAGRDIEHIVVLSTGDVTRKRADGSWETLESGALTGDRPGTATLFGKTFFADGLGYRVYNHETGQLRDFEAAVAGEFPPRCRLIAAYNSRLIVAGGDNAFTVYQSRFGDPFDFDYGPEIQTISQAIAGTTASQGNPPEPITALMPFRDARLYIGTTESLFVQTGDLADGGRLDQLDKSQGVAPGYAWCESPMGLYYFSARGGVMFIRPDGMLSMVSSGAIQRRLEEIDLTANRIDLAYNWIDKAVHVFVIPNALGSETEHYVYEEPMQAWHKDTFSGGIDRAVTTAVSQVGDTPEDRALFLGFGGGYMRRWDQYATDDAGEPVHSSATVGPLIPSRTGVETRVRGIYAQLASDQGPVEVAVRGSEAADAPGPPGPFSVLAPGRGLGVGVNIGAPAVYIDIRGLGQAWAVHELRAEVNTRGSVRSRS